MTYCDWVWKFYKQIFAKLWKSSDIWFTWRKKTHIYINEYICSSVTGHQSAPNCPETLKCYEPHEAVRYEKTGCDNNTCETALSGPRPCAQYIQKITWCDCVAGYFRNSKGHCVTRQQCIDEQTPNCDLRCDKPHFRVRYEKTGCDNNTCETALSGPRPCAQYVQKITWCDCEEGYFRDSLGNCVTRKQCQEEQNGRWFQQQFFQKKTYNF